MPEIAARPCALYRLPLQPSQSDLEIGYATRGAQLVSCNAARQLAVDTHKAERELEAKAQVKPKRWWDFRAPDS